MTTSFGYSFGVKSYNRWYKKLVLRDKLEYVFILPKPQKQSALGISMNFLMLKNVRKIFCLDSISVKSLKNIPFIQNTTNNVMVGL